MFTNQSPCRFICISPKRLFKLKVKNENTKTKIQLKQMPSASMEINPFVIVSFVRFVFYFFYLRTEKYDEQSKHEESTRSQRCVLPI